MRALTGLPVSRPQVRYMISEIQYGGRITDDFDRTLMNTYAEQYFHQGVMDKACQLYPGYKVPDGLEIGHFRQVSPPGPSAGQSPSANSLLGTPAVTSQE